MVKNLPANAGDTGSIPEIGRSPGRGMVTQSSILAWRIPWTEEPGRLQSMGSQRVGYNWVTEPARTGFRQSKTKRMVIPDRVLGLEGGRNLAYSRDDQRNPLSPVDSEEEFYLFVHHCMYPALDIPASTKEALSKIYRRDKDWIDIFLGNSWRDFESRDCLDVAYCPPLCSSPNYIQVLGLLVIPGYSRPLAARLFQTFLTAVKYLNGSWPGESLHRKGRKKECRPLQLDQFLSRRSELALWQCQD